jgi:long-chain acyl-CoA synthetase
MVSYLYLVNLIKVYFVNDTKNIIPLLQKIKPTIFITVPRLLEKIFIITKNKAESMSGVTGIILRKAIHYANTHEPFSKNTIINSIWNFVYNKFVFRPIQEKLGGKLKMIICGGAILDNSIYRFFSNVGLTIYQGYGLTETSPVISSNYHNQTKSYTVGHIFDGVNIIIDDKTGEILVNGNNVMLGYYHNKKSTDQSFIKISKDKNKKKSDSFFKTGDIGFLDKDNYLTITGRIKEQFKTSTGKYINPIKIENMINSINGVDQSCVVANGRKFVIVIIFPNENFSINENKINELVHNIDIAIPQINQTLEHHEQIVKFYIHTKTISVFTGELTPSLKLKRNFIEEKFQKIINDLYKEE